MAHRTERRAVELASGRGIFPSGSFVARFSRSDLWLAAATAAPAFGVYVLTAAPTVTAEDSGELAAAAWTLGIPHPPGYPLYVLLARAFLTLVPFGEVAWRLSVLSGLLAALAVGLNVLLARRLAAPPEAAAAAGVLAAFSPLLWSQATVAEVYPLAAVVFLAVVHWTVLYLLRPAPARLLVLSWAAGLALAAHPSLVLLLPGVLAAVFLRDPGVLRRAREVVAAAGFALLGFSIYLYLPLRSLADPPMDWGDPETLEGFLAHLLRLQYAGLGRPPAHPVLDRLLYLGHLALFELGPVVTLLAAAGLGALLGFPGSGDWPRERGRARRAFRAAYVLWALAFSAGLLFVLTVSFEKRTLALNAVFFIPLLLLLVPAVALGLARCARAIGAAAGPLGAPRWRWAAVAALGGALLLWSWRDQDRSGTTIAREYAESILETLPEGAVYIPGSDHSNFPLLYLQLVEGRRPDVVMADKYGYLDPAYLRRLASSEEEAREVRRMSRREAERWLIDRSGRPVFVNSKRSILEVPPESFEPVGILYRVDRGRRPLGPEEEERLWASYRFRNLGEDWTWRGGGRDPAADFVVAEVLFLRAEYHFRRGEAQQALGCLERLREVAGEYKSVMQNAGSLLAEKGRVKEASEFYEAALALDPEYAECRRNYAWVLLKAGLDLPKAIRLAERSLEELEPEGSLLRALGDAYRKERRYENARQAYLAAAQLDRADWKASRLAGEVSEEDLKEPKVARLHFHESLRRKPTQPDLIEKLHGVEARRRYEEGVRGTLERLGGPEVPALGEAAAPAGYVAE